MTVKSANRYLVVGPAWVGDMVMTQSLLKAIKQQNPNAVIDVIAPPWSVALLERMPEVDHSITLPIGHGEFKLGMRLRLGRQLRDRYDIAIVVPRSFKSALVPFFAGIPDRRGWRGEMRYGLLNDIRLLNKKRYPLMVQRLVAHAYPANTPAVEDYPFPELVVDKSQFAALRGKFELNPDRPVLALCPGAEFGPAKRWPEGHYAAVAETKIQQGWQVWLMGSAKDSVVAEDIRANLPESDRAHCINLAGQTSLAEAIDLMAMADAVVSNDSGLMHIAAALGRPLVVVYGSTSPGYTPPLSHQVQVESIAVDCGPCFKRECPLGHLKCLQDLSPAKVLKALDKLSLAPLPL